MPITVIPAPHPGPDPLEQTMRMYQLMTEMQQAPIRQQILRTQLAGEQQQQGLALKADARAEKASINSQATADRQAKQDQRQEDVQAAQAGQMDYALQQAVRVGKMTPEQAAAASGVAKLGDPKLLPPEAQAVWWSLQLKANPEMALEHEINQKQLAELNLRMQETSLRVDKLKKLGGSADDVKDLVAQFNSLMDNARQSANDSYNANIEASPAGALTRAQSMFSREHPGEPMYETRLGKPIVGPDGKPVPTANFAGYVASETAKADLYKAKSEGAQQLHDGTISFAKKYVPELGDYFGSTFAGGSQVSQQSRLQMAVSSLDTIKAKMGDAAVAEALSKSSLKLQRGPLFDSSFDVAFPPQTGEDPAQRAALRARIKAYMDYQPPKPPAGSTSSVGTIGQ